MSRELRDLLERSRDELFIAKGHVRAVRNFTKVHAAALDDSEKRIDSLIAEIDELRNPTPEEAQEHGSNHAGEARKEVAAVGG